MYSLTSNLRPNHVSPVISYRPVIIMLHTIRVSRRTKNQDITLHLDCEGFIFSFIRCECTDRRRRRFSVSKYDHAVRMPINY